MRINLFGKKKIVSEDEEFQDQVENYDTIAFTHSSRKIAASVIVIFSAITGAFYYFEVVTIEYLWGTLLYLILAFFVFKGHRWAIIAVMIMWTADKGYQIGIGQGTPIAIFFWWIALISPLYSALRVENARRKRNLVTNTSTQDFVHSPASTGNQSLFCSKCGTKLLDSASFCQKCGSKTI